MTSDHWWFLVLCKTGSEAVQRYNAVVELPSFWRLGAVLWLFILFLFLFCWVLKLKNLEKSRGGYYHVILRPDNSYLVLLIGCVTICGNSSDAVLSRRREQRLKNVCRFIHLATTDDLTRFIIRSVNKLAKNWHIWKNRKIRKTQRIVKIPQFILIHSSFLTMLSIRSTNSFVGARWVLTERTPTSSEAENGEYWLLSQIQLHLTSVLTSQHLTTTSSAPCGKITN